jgi:hypothetical protein
MSQHYCEYNAHTNGRLDIEPCGVPATGKWRGKWYCDDHPESMEGHAGLMHALNEFAREGEGEQ